jgi:hypothetical protein
MNFRKKGAIPIYSVNAVAEKQMTAEDNPIRMSNI